MGGTIISGPIRDALVLVEDRSGRIVYGTRSDGRGHFVLQLPRPMEAYPLTVRATGGWDIGRDVPSDLGTLVTLIPEPAARAVVVGLPQPVDCLRWVCRSYWFKRQFGHCGR
jgi:hypothetical protein